MWRADRSGTVVGHYRILERIGGGGMGVVYRAEDLKLGRTVALKFLSEEMARDPQALERFHREARAASALDHPGICTIHDIGEVDGIPFLVMEYLEGKSLKSMVEEHPLDIDLLVDLGIQVGEALEALHALGMVHRDIKPGNIFVTDRGQAKILDFGLAKLRPAAAEAGVAAEAGEGQALISAPERGAPATAPHPPAARKQTFAGMIAGTAEYMSPEQARGEPLDARSDIFSFCVVLYEMAAGREPFTGDTSSVIRYAVLHRKPRPLRRANAALPPELERIVQRGLEKDPARRYQNMGELLADLRRLRLYRESHELGEALLPAIAPPSPPPGELHGWARSTWVWLAVATVALLLAAAAALWDLRSRTTALASVHSLAVLPLENVSGDPGQQYLSDGMAESITDSLSQLGTVSVVARRSAFLLPGKNLAPQDAARALGAESLLTGRLTSRGDDLDLQMELIEARNAVPLWSGEYHSRRSQVHLLPAEVARAVAQGLRLRISPAESLRLAQGAPGNASAYELYLQGRYLLSTPTRANLERADEKFEQAIQADANYAPAFAARAGVWLESQEREYAATADALAKVRPEVERALQLDPGLARAHLARANLRYRLEWDWALTGDEFQKAVALDPAEGDAHRWYALYLGFLGRYDDSMAEIAQAVRLEPLDPRAHAGRGRVLLLARQYAEAEAAFRKALELDPASAEAHRGLAAILESKGDCREGAAERIRGWQAAGLSPLAETARNGLEAGGCRGAAQRALEGLLRSPELAPLHPTELAAQYLELGAREKALEWLERAWQTRNVRMLDLRGDPAFDAMRGDPRFEDIFRRMKPPE
jgi:serine/threonine protein kinase/TolB-like protein/Tfp pilus assembly protein PilF